MLTSSANPRIDYRIVDGRRNWVEALLLSNLIWVIQVEFVNEFIERHGEI